MPQGPRPEKPYRMRDTRLALPDKARQETQNKHLRPEKQPSLNTDVVRLSPGREPPGFCGSFRFVRKSYPNT